MLNPGCDRIPIESLEWDNPECVFVMVLALAGSYHNYHDYHDHGDYHYLDKHNPKAQTCLCYSLAGYYHHNDLCAHHNDHKHDD